MAQHSKRFIELRAYSLRCCPSLCGNITYLPALYKPLRTPQAPACPAKSAPYLCIWRAVNMADYVVLKACRLVWYHIDKQRAYWLVQAPVSVFSGSLHAPARYPARPLKQFRSGYFKQVITLYRLPVVWYTSTASVQGEICLLLHILKRNATRCQPSLWRL